ncbi:MAG: hypothetical protein QXE31_04590 [Candidatus Woesearchaeota archaeon]
MSRNYINKIKMIKDVILKKKFTYKEINFLKKLNTPEKIQNYINTLDYNTGKRLCVLKVLRLRKADCVEAAIFASFVLSIHNIKNFLITLEAVRDEDHFICVYKEKNRYGSLAQSKFLGLRDRKPVYKTIKELVMSYYEHYFNFYGELTLRRYSLPYYLKGDKWIYHNKEIYKIDKESSNVKMFSILSKDIEKKRFYVSKERFYREIIIFPKNVKIGKKYIQR